MLAAKPGSLMYQPETEKEMFTRRSQIGRTSDKLPIFLGITTNQLRRYIGGTVWTGKFVLRVLREWRFLSLPQRVIKLGFLFRKGQDGWDVRLPATLF
jgi:hypothetical protein